MHLQREEPVSCPRSCGQSQEFWLDDGRSLWWIWWCFQVGQHLFPFAKNYMTFRFLAFIIVLQRYFDSNGGKSSGYQYQLVADIESSMCQKQKVQKIICTFCIKSFILCRERVWRLIGATISSNFGTHTTNPSSSSSVSASSLSSEAFAGTTSCSTITMFLRLTSSLVQWISKQWLTLRMEYSGDTGNRINM